MTIISIYLIFLKIGLLGFGGGYLMIPLFFLEIVEKTHWMSHDQLFNILAVAQLVPGTFATNSAVLIGLSVGHLGYAVAALAGIVTPVMFTAYLAERYVRPFLNKPGMAGFLTGLTAAVIGIIAATGFNLMHAAVVDAPTMLTGLLAFYLFYSRHWNAASAAIVAAMAGLALFFFL